MNEYECGTCGSQEIHISSYIPGVWLVSCGNGHPWVPTGQERIVIHPTLKQQVSRDQ